MSFKLGLDAKLYRNTATYASPTWSELTNVRDLTLSLEKGEADVTTRANGGWRALAGTLKEGSIEFEMVWDPADAGFTAIKDAWFNDESIEFAVMDGALPPPSGGTSQGLRATMQVLSFSRSEPLEEAMTVSVTIKPTYAANAPEWMTATTP